MENLTKEKTNLVLSTQAENIQDLYNKNNIKAKVILSNDLIPDDKFWEIKEDLSQKISQNPLFKRNIEEVFKKKTRIIPKMVS